MEFAAKFTNDDVLKKYDRETKERREELVEFLEGFSEIFSNINFSQRIEIKIVLSSYLNVLHTFSSEGRYGDEDWKKILNLAESLDIIDSTENFSIMASGRTSINVVVTGVQDFKEVINKFSSYKIYYSRGDNYVYAWEGRIVVFFWYRRRV